MATNTVVVDADILSMFAKADALDALRVALGHFTPVMTPAIRDEIMVPMQYGFAFPQKILGSIPTVPLNKDALDAYERLASLGRPVGRGELEAIAYCQVTGAIFATNDAKARSFAQEQHVRVLSLQAILRTLWEVRGWPKERVYALLERIKVADHLTLSAQVEAEIFEE